MLRNQGTLMRSGLLEQERRQGMGIGSCWNATTQVIPAEGVTWTYSLFDTQTRRVAPADTRNDIWALRPEAHSPKKCKDTVQHPQPYGRGPEHEGRLLTVVSGDFYIDRPFSSFNWLSSAVTSSLLLCTFVHVLVLHLKAHYRQTSPKRHTEHVCLWKHSKCALLTCCSLLHPCSVFTGWKEEADVGSTLSAFRFHLSAGIHVATSRQQVIVFFIICTVQLITVGRTIFWNSMGDWLH